jgi:hypothetical protein
MKQTAVEWLFNELSSENLSWNKYSNGKLFIDLKTSDIYQQAKEMEKEQIINALMTSEVELLAWGISAEQYYNKNYKSK